MGRNQINAPEVSLLIAKSLVQLLQSPKKEKSYFFALITLGTVIYRDSSVKASISSSDITAAIDQVMIAYPHSVSLVQACQDMRNILS